MNRFGALLIFISIIILCAVYVSVAKPQLIFERRNDTARISDLKKIAQALSHFYNDYGHYPPATSDYKISVGEDVVSWGGTWDPYISQMPSDPFLRSYAYVPTKDNNYQSYRLYASLEDPGAVPNACVGECPNVPEAQICGGFICNYAVTSGNVSP